MCRGVYSGPYETLPVLSKTVSAKMMEAAPKGAVFLPQEVNGVGIELYSHVRLKDGREGAVVEMDGPDHYLVDVGSSPADWETISVPASEIVEVL